MSRNAHTIEPVLIGLAGVGSSVVAVIQSRFDPDIVAVIGAFIAAIIAVVEAREKNRDMLHLICVFLASMGVGSALPGACVWTWAPASAPTLAWQVWALLGGISGLLGWAFTAAILALRGRVPGLINRGANRFLPPEEKNEP